MAFSPYLGYSKNKSNRKGTDYELALSILFLKRAVESSLAFKLATERKCDEKFDDMFLEIGDSEKRLYFVQAKHRDDTSKRITYDDLSSKDDSNFSLPKYFNSFRKLKRIVDENDFKNARFLLLTTIDLDLQSLAAKGMSAVEITDKDDDILGTAKSRMGKLYRLEVISDEVKDALFTKVQSGMKVVSRKLCEHFLLGKKLNIGQSHVLKSYHVALAKEVLHLVDNSCIKFREEFVSNSDYLSEEVKTFRQVFYESAREQLKEMMVKQHDREKYEKVIGYFEDVMSKDASDEVAIETFWNKMKPKTVEVVGEFGKLGITNKRLKELVDELRVKIIENPEKSFVISQKTDFGKSIFKLMGYVFTVQSNNVFLFNKYFLKSDELPESFADLRNKLKVSLGDDEFQKLHQRELNFTVDVKDEEKIFKEKVHWDIGDDCQKEDFADAEPDDFLEKFTVVVTPKEDSLRRRLKNEMTKEFGDREGEVICDTLHSVMVDWMTSVDENGMGIYLTKEENPYCKAIENHTLPCWFNVREPVATFTGREGDLLALHEMLQAGNGDAVMIVQNVVVSGMGGLGKSELAKKYAKDFKDHYRGNVIWIDAEATTISKSFLHLARELKIIDDHQIESEHTKKIDGKHIAREVYKRFARKKSLFIFDNAQDYREIEPFLPNFGSHVFSPKILITSRKRELFKEQEHRNVRKLDLNLFSTEVAVEFIRKAMKPTENAESDDDIRVLVDILGRLPLALQQAVAYINQTSCGISSYTKLLTESKNFMESFLSKNNLYSYDMTIYMTFKVTFDKILSTEDDGKFSLQVLHMIAYMAPDRIPVEMFKSLAMHQVVGEEETVKDILADNLLKKSIKLLHQYSLIDFIDGTKYLNVHRLVQHVIRQTLCHARVDNDCGYTLSHPHIDKANENIVEESILRKGFELAYSFEKIDDIDNIVTHILSLWVHADGKRNLINSFIKTKFNYDATAMHVLSQFGYAKLIESILCTVRDPESHNNMEEMPWWRFADRIKLWKKKKESEALLADVIEAKDQFNNTPLGYAAHSGSLDNIKVLVANGADVNIKSSDGTTPLHDAAEGGFEDCVKYFVEEANIDSKVTDRDGILPIDVAAFNGHVRIVKYLLEKSQYDMVERSVYILHATLYSDSDSKMKDIEEIFEGLSSEIAKRVIETDLDYELFDSRDALDAAVIKCDQSVVGYLMEKAGLVEPKDLLNVLRKAVYCRNPWVVEWLLELGAMSALDGELDRFFLLNKAILRGNIAVLKCFVDYFGGVEELNIDMKMVLDGLMFCGKIHVLKFLLKRGANFTSSDMSHSVKISNARYFITDYLKKRRVENYKNHTSLESVTCLSQLDLTPLNVACALNELERVKQLLEEREKSSPSTVEDIEISIKIAMLYDNEELIEYLVLKYSSMYF